VNGASADADPQVPAEAQAGPGPDWTSRLHSALEPLAPLQLQARWAGTAASTCFFLAAGVLLWLAVGVQERSLLLLGIVLLVVGAADFVLRPRLDGLTVVEDTGLDVRVGDRRCSTLLVSNAGTRRTSACLVHAELPGHEPAVVVLPPLAPGQELEVPVERLAVRRGTSPVCVLRLRARSPLGLVSVARDDVLSEPGMLLRVWPEHVPAPDLRPSTAAAFAAQQAEAAPGAGLEIYGLRPWRSGEGSGALSARATARHGRPVVLQREREQGRRLVLLVGGGSAGPLWDAAVARAAAVGVAAVRAGHPVSVVGPPSSGRWSATAVLDALADADAAPPLDESAVRRALQAAGPGGRIVLLAPATQAAERSRARRLAAAARCELVVLDG
jgi:uncharacterized protein (DUF58 family)